MHPPGTAAQTLDRIRRGGTHLILAAQHRLAEAKVLIDKGEFKEALVTVAQLHEKLAALAEAEGALGTVADAQILRCSEVESGMRLVDVGVVTAITPCPCEQEFCDRIVLTIDGQPVNFAADAELVVADAEPDAHPA